MKKDPEILQHVFRRAFFLSFFFFFLPSKGFMVIYSRIHTQDKEPELDS